MQILRMKDLGKIGLIGNIRMFLRKMVWILVKHKIELSKNDGYYVKELLSDAIKSPWRKGMKLHTFKGSPCIFHCHAPMQRVNGV